MTSTNQQCITCDDPIIGDAYHLILAGSVYRFCCHLHRQEYVRASTQLVASGSRARVTSLAGQSLR
jgi:hypothetical protein